MTKTFSAAAILITLLVGCRLHENVHQLQAINKTLEQTNDWLQDGIRMSDMQMREKYVDPITTGRATIWLSWMEKIKNHVDSINAVIDTLKYKLLEQSDSLKKSDIALVKELSAPNGSGLILFHKMSAFKDSLPSFFDLNKFSHSPGFQEQLMKDISRFFEAFPLLTGYKASLAIDAKERYIQNWLKDNFEGNSPMADIVMLNRIKSDVLIIEKWIFEYSNAHVGANFCGYFKPGALASMSSGYVKSGQPIDIQVGVGLFSDAVNATILVNGERVYCINERPTAWYRFTPTGKPGKHSVPVQVSYLNEDGVRKTETHNLEYTIAE